MKFECKESCLGKCCKQSSSGDIGYIFLSDDDIARLEKHLNKSKYWFVSWGMFTSAKGVEFKEPKQLAFLKQRNPCRFLNDGKCMVYEARPEQCKTYPFWPGMDFKKEAEFCPGIEYTDGAIEP